jgi:glycosyltransferase involved in cell wall biosynthesis
VLKFLYVSNTRRKDRPYSDPSTRYRCYNPAEDLESLGHLADVTSFYYFTLEMINRYDVLIFHRPPNNDKLLNALDLAKKKNKLVFADYDDLIFSPEHTLDTSLYKRDKNKEEVSLLIKGNFKAMNQFEQFIASTTPLAKILKTLKQATDNEVHVVHNGLSFAMQHIAAIETTLSPTKKYLSYLSGTASHDLDFKKIQPALAACVLDRNDLALMLVGELEYNDSIPAHRVYYHPSVPYQRLPQYIKKSWVNLAPLEESSFNQCKSGLKFFESAIFGIPSIVSPIPDCTRFTDSGILFAKEEEEWIDTINHLYQDDAYYHALSKQVRSYALTHCLSIKQTTRFLEITKRLLP